MDHTQIFNGKAGDYAFARPAYANALIDYLYARQGFAKKSVIADIGAGTGKFSRQLLDRGSFLFCVEPNDDMRAAAERELGTSQSFKAVNGTAAETTLADHCVDFVTAAQAFHWFDAALFRRECKRILKPGRKAVLVWNMRDRSAGVNQAVGAVYSRYCPGFHGFSGGMEQDDERIREFFSGRYEYVEFDHPLFYTKEKFISRSLSSSYSLKRGDDGYPRYVAALSALFDTYAEEGIVEVPNRTAAYLGVPGAS